MKTTLACTVAALALTLGACSSQPAADTTAAANTSAAADTAPMTPDPAGDVQRLRGTAEQVSANDVALRGYDGQNATVSLDGKTRFAWVEKASLSDIKTGDYVGTATTGQGDAMRAIEVVIFPESMRGSGEGHYAWSTPAALQQQGGQGSSAMTNGTVQDSAMTNGTVQNSAMTNGTVQDSAMTNGTVQDSAMTNGTVQGATPGSGDTRLNVSYNGGSVNVLVPQGTPVVRFVPSDRASLTRGQKLFVVAKPAQSGNPAAQFVAMGRNGLTPPM